ncbi:hypothetical protein [Streptomyces griseoluteus]
MALALTTPVSLPVSGSPLAAHTPAASLDAQLQASPDGRKLVA